MWPESKRNPDAHEQTLHSYAFGARDFLPDGSSTPLRAGSEAWRTIMPAAISASESATTWTPRTTHSESNPPPKGLRELRITRHTTPAQVGLHHSSFQCE